MSELLKIRGLVLKETPIGEADKFINILAKDYGKVSVSVRGAKQVRNGLSAGTALFSYSDFYISKTKKRMYLNQTDPIETFYNLRNDVTSLSYGSYFVEMINNILYENSPSNNILLLLIKTLGALVKDIIPKQLISTIFELKLLEYSGYKPEISHCVVCGKETDENFYMISEGSICENCVNEKRFKIKLNETLLYTIGRIYSSPLNKLYKFGISPQSIKSLSTLSRHMIAINFNLRLNSQKFIEEIENFSAFY